MRNKLSILLSFISILAPIAVSARKIKKNVTRIEIVGDVSGVTKITDPVNEDGKAKVTVKVDRLPTSIINDLDDGDLLEAWLVDSGLGGGSGSSNVDDDDNEAGNLPFDNATTPLGFTISDATSNPVTVSNVPLFNLVEAAPYALSLGKLKRNSAGDYVTSVQFRGMPGTGYTQVMITIEKEGDNDPRPGVPLGSGNF